MSRYPPTYRTDEIDLVIRLGLRGQSLGFVGIAGVGKSNLINFLRDIQQHAPQLQQNIETLHFPVVDGGQWQGTAANLWQMMLEALNQNTKKLPPPTETESNKIIPISEDERIMRALQDRLWWICQELKHQVMFILDDFDQVIETGPLAMLERLNGLRNEGNREYLSYLVFTKRLPHVLGRQYDFENRSKFYDLFRHHIYALRPYTRTDAMQMLRHLNALAGNRLDDEHLEQIYQLAGGQALLLKIVFNIWIEEGASGVKVAYFSTKPDVQQECHRIFTNLHEHEQEVALRIVRDQQTAEDQAVIEHLERRGLITKMNPITWFSPLMAHFLKTYEG